MKNKVLELLSKLYLAKNRIHLSVRTLIDVLTFCEKVGISEEEFYRSINDPSPPFLIKKREFMFRFVIMCNELRILASKPIPKAFKRKPTLQDQEFYLSGRTNKLT